MKKMFALLVVLAALAVASTASAGDPEGWKVRCNAQGECEFYWG